MAVFLPRAVVVGSTVAAQKRIGIGWTPLLIWIRLRKRWALLMDQQPPVAEVEAKGEKRKVSTFSKTLRHNWAQNNLSIALS
jgi:hypothetical protein